MATKEQIHNFINTIGPTCKKVVEDLGYSDVVLQGCIAHACLETGCNLNGIMWKYYGIFGISADAGWVKAGNKFYNANTKECYDGKTYTGLVKGFRAYDSLEDSIRNYFKLLSWSRYNKSFLAKNVKEYITILRDGGYATAIRDTYINSVVNYYDKNKDIINKYLPNKNNNITELKTETPKTNDTDELVLNIIRGFYGNGSARKKKLEAEGYNYKEIQSLVNKKMAELVQDTIDGKYGNGKERKIKLGDLYLAVQYEVNKKLK